MATSMRAVRMGFVCLAVATCAGAVPLCAQQLSALAVGAVWPVSPAPGRDIVGDSLR